MIKRFFVLFIISVYFLLAAINAFSTTLPPQIQFQNYTIEDGLSHNWANCTLQDEFGYIWIGTRNGLNKFNGYSFTHYENHYQDSTSLSGNYIYCMTKDSNDLWLGTMQSGLSRYISNLDKFQQFPLDINILDSEEELRSIRALLLVNNDLWIGTGTGVYIYNKQNGTFREFHYNSYLGEGAVVSSIVQGQNGSIYIGTNMKKLVYYVPSTDQVLSIDLPGIQNNNKDDVYDKRLFVDSDGDVWIGSYGNGLWIFNPKNKSISRYTSQMGSNSIHFDQLMGFEEVRPGIIWIATDNGGINIFNKRSKTVSELKADAADPYSIASNGIYHIFKDRDERIWISTFEGGISLWDQNKQKFQYYYHKINNANSLSHNNVISLCGSIDGTIWVGTDGGGLCQFFPETGTFKRFKSSEDEMLPIYSSYITALMIDSKQRLWIAGLYNGISILDLKTGELKHLPHNDVTSSDIPSSPIWDFLEDHEGNIWFGTMGSGLVRYDEYHNKSKYYIFVLNDTSSLSSNHIYDIFEDKDGKIWVATAGSGLNRLDPNTGIFERFVHDRNNPESISNNSINGIYELTNGDIWITTDNGLNKLNADGKSFTVYRESDGLPDNQVYDILEDNDNNLWISSGNGLYEFNPRSGMSRTFYQGDGLQSNQFSQTAALKSISGLFYFGGIYGLNCFYPDSIYENFSQPPIVLSQLLIFNKPVYPQTEGSPLQKHILTTDHITLNHKQNVFSLDFATLDFTNPQKIKYQYRLEGFDNEWNETTSEQRRATYTNLTSGQYEFKVISTNSDDKWTNQLASLKITVMPPYWQTWWFRLIIVLLILGAFLFLHFYRTFLIQKRNIELEKMNIVLGKEVEDRKKAEKIVKKSLKEKEVLLKEIHHRVKNNLQVISSLLSLQSSKIKDPHFLDMFKDSKSRVRSMALIHEKLYQSDDFTHINFKVYTNSLMQEIRSSFREVNRNIDFKVAIQNVNLPIDIAVPCGLVINELVTNAYKYAFPGSFKGMPQITVSMDVEDKNVLLQVIDNGVGLPSSVEPTNVESLGLRLVQILVKDQMHGEVNWHVDSGTSWLIKFDCDGI